jgi:hypothetical protein
MFYPTAPLIDACLQRLRQTYQHLYGSHEPHYAELIDQAGRLALETISTSDALYHNIEHTVMVTLVGQDILQGKHLRDGGVSPYDWLHCMIALLYHDIGYVRGTCRDDRHGTYTTGIAGETVTLPPGATDAALTPYHIDRGKCFVRECFGSHAIINADIVAANIERTRFPVPDTSDHQGTADYPGLVRAADLIGQLADPQRPCKLPALFYEFEETGINAKLGYTTPADLRADYPSFFWNVVSRYIQDGLRYLGMTQEGRQWIVHLYAQVFAVEHHDRIAAWKFSVHGENSI